MTPTLTAINEQATVRLVPSGYAKPPVLLPLVDSRHEEDLLAKLEGMTSGRLLAERDGLPDLNPRELTYQIWGYTHINAAFSYTREEGNRFNDKSRGAWYCAFEDVTALEEVASIAHVNSNAFKCLKMWCSIKVFLQALSAIFTTSEALHQLQTISR